MSLTFSSEDVNEATKIKAINPQIIVSGSAEQPYYSIEYYDVEKEQFYIGFGSCYLSTVFKWRDECFDVVVGDADVIIRILKADKEALIAGQETLQKALAEKIEESENQSQNFKVLVSDHRCLQRSFDNLKGLYEADCEIDKLPAANVIEIPEGGIGELSDGYHTFNELYHHRAVLFSVICNSMPDKAWKSKLHDTGDMFDGMFIVGIETPNGQATYHYDIDPYWDMFKVKELDNAPEWDGHTPQQAVERISLIISDDRVHGRWINDPPYTAANGKYLKASECSVCHSLFVSDGNTPYSNHPYCCECGSKMDIK